MKKLAQLTLGLLLVLTVACDKKGSDPAPAPVAPATQYGYVNNTCHDLTTNQPVTANYCANVVINGGYRWNGIICMDANGQTVAQTLCNIGTGGTSNYRWNGTQCTDLNNVPVAATLCQNINNGSGQFQLVGNVCVHTISRQPVMSSYCAGLAGYNANICSGYYIKYYADGLFYYTKYCYGSRCSGETLVEYMTGRTVTCQ